MLNLVFAQTCSQEAIALQDKVWTELKNKRDSTFDALFDFSRFGKTERERKPPRLFRAPPGSRGSHSINNKDYRASKSAALAKLSPNTFGPRRRRESQARRINPGGDRGRRPIRFALVRFWRDRFPRI